MPSTISPLSPLVAIQRTSSLLQMLSPEVLIAKLQKKMAKIGNSSSSGNTSIGGDLVKENPAWPTIFNPQTCKKKGVCKVGEARSIPTHDIYYEVHSSDPNPTTRVLFIMGLNNTCFGWCNQVEYFSQLPSYEVLTFDNRGVGNSDSPNGIYKTTDMAGDVIELLDFLGWKEKRSVHAVGVSMGGMISQHLALSIPERIASLTLLSTKAGNKIDPPPLKGLTMFGTLLTIGNFLTDEQKVSILVDGLFPPSYLDSPDPQNPGRTRRKTVEKDYLDRVLVARKQPFQGKMAQLAAAMTHKVVQPQLKEIGEKIPKVCVITGDQDSLIHPQSSLDLKEAIPGSEYVLFEGGGHALPSQTPEELNAKLKRVFEEGLERSNAGQGL